MARVLSSSPVRSNSPSPPRRRGLFAGGGRRRDRIEKAPPKLSDNPFTSTTNPPLKSCLSSNNLSTMNAASSDSMMKRSVSFHKIEIREYERALGDNPCVSAGPPIALGWQYDPSHTVLNVEDYESARPSRRTRSEFIMSQDDRVSMLRKEWGVSGHEMMKSIRDVNVVKRKRRATVATRRSADKRQELLEMARRKAKRLVSPKDAENEKLWKDAQKYATSKNEDMLRSMSLNDLESEKIVGILDGSTLGGAKMAAYGPSSNVTQSCHDLRLLSLGECKPEDGNCILNHYQVPDSGKSVAATIEDSVRDEWGFGLDED